MESVMQRIHGIIDGDPEAGAASRSYNMAMTALIIVSLVPLAFKDEGTALGILDKACAAVFVADYLLRWATADMRPGASSPMAFLRYPITPMAVIDLVSILPSFVAVNAGFKALRCLRLARSLRVLRVFRLVRHSKSLRIVVQVLRDSKGALATVGAFAVGYLLVSALVVFNVEPDSFDSFFDAVYWATVSLTTVGYGDIYPVSAVGRVVAMASSVFGIAIVALPAGIITAGYMRAIESESEDDSQ